MSATITLKHTMARSRGAASNLIQHSLMIVGVLFVLAVVSVFVNRTPAVDVPEYALPGLPSLAELTDLADLTAAIEPSAAIPVSETGPAVLSSRMQGALDYVTRRYRVSPEALVPVFEVAQLIGKERRIDPLLIVAIIGIESGFKSDAKSAGGGHGLMQIIPRYHLNKIPDGLGVKGLMDPAVNVKVGTIILDDAISRAGNPVGGLQSYNGSKKKKLFANRVLAEKSRMELAAP